MQLVRTICFFVTLLVPTLAPTLAPSISQPACGQAPTPSEDAALNAPRILQPIPESYADEHRQFQGIPSITRSPGGRLWATWYAGGVGEGPDNYVLLATSGDDGITWTKPLLAVDPDGKGPLRAFDPAMWTDPDGGVWLYWAQGASWWDGRAGVWAMKCESPENADSMWAQPRRLFDGIMMCRPIADSRGRWLFPAAVWQRKPNSAKEFAQDLGARIGANVMVSTDQGRTYQWLGQAKAPANEAAFDEHMLLEKRDGSFSMYLRTKYGIGVADSMDHGKTWSPVRPSSWAHPSARFFVTRLQSGNLLLVKHGAMDQRLGRSHLTAHLSEDDGRTWKHSLLLDERSGVSYPDGVQDKDGKIFVIYDYNRTREKKILLARFTEADIKTGSVATTSSQWTRLRLEINQATGAQPPPKPKKYVVDQNADGAAMKLAPRAEVVGDGAKDEVDTFRIGVKLFHDRNYKLQEAPQSLKGRQFLRSGIDGVTTFSSKRAGVVYVLTPQPNRNRDSVVKALTELGFERVRHPEVMMFDSNPANLCTLFQKQLKAGEQIAIGKWGVVVW